MLDLSIRQIKRLFQAYKAQGAKGLISARRGKPSNNRLDPQVVQQAFDFIYEHYRDFGPTLAHEKLTEVHQLHISRETVRRIMIQEQIWKPKRAKKPTVHQMRERRACIGELIQIDGSDHACVVMDTTSTANLLSRSRPMPPIKMGWPVSLSLLAENRAESREQSRIGSALSSASGRRSGRSPALPYPPSKWLESTISVYHPLAKGTSLL
jgi:hypothetical protein